MNGDEMESSGGTFSLINHTLPFAATREQFDEIRAALLAECDRWRKDNFTWTERLRMGLPPATSVRTGGPLSWPMVLVLLHECTHFWHVIGTTYGFHLMRIAMAQSYWTRKLLDRLDEQGLSKFRLPLSELDLSSCTDAARCAIRAIQNHWRNLEIYRDALHAFSMSRDVSVHDFFNHIWPGAVGALDEFDRSADTFRVRTQARHLRLDHPTNIPTVAPVHPTYGLNMSGQAVMESAALAQEALLLVQLRDRGELTHEFVDRRLVETPAYGMATNLLADAIPDFDREPTRSKLARLLPRLFDLALMGPVDPDYGFDLPKALNWLDIHPGFRFRLIMNTVKEIGLGGIIQTRYFGRSYDRLIGEICRRNNWPTPKTMAGWARRRRGGFKSEYEGFGAHLSVNPIVDPTVTHFGAMVLRTGVPGLFAEIVANCSALFDHLPPPFIHLDDASVINSLWGGYVFHHGAMRTIFAGTQSELARRMAGPATASQFDKEIDDLFRLMLRAKVGYELNRFE